MYRMVCVDMDGTLLNKRKKISHQDRLALKRAYDERKIYVVIATGRIYKDASYYSKLLGIKSSIISGNGAFVKDELNNKIISKDTLSKENLKAILSACDKFKVHPNFYTIDSIFIYPKIYTLIEKILMVRKPKSFKVKIINIKNRAIWKDVIRKNEKNIIKGLVFSFNTKRLEMLQKYIVDKLNLEAYMSSKFTLEINSKGIDKAKAVIDLERYYGIKREEIICIGDNENDILMIEYAGLGVSMGNAKESIKKKSDFITLDNNNCGVAHVIFKYILGK